MTEPWITLLTDYGTADIYVGVLHGVVARAAPAARIIDVTHAIPAGDVLAGALALADALAYLPVGIHVAVVDPGVGGGRRGVALTCADGRVLIGPDNGLLGLAAARAGGVHSAVDISESPWRLSDVSATFHGRDIFVPVAAALAAGQPFAAAGPPVAPESLVALTLPEVRVSDGDLSATVTAVDAFGNLAVHATPEDAARAGLELGQALSVNALPGRYARTFSEVHASELLLYVDSTGRLGLAVSGGSAAGALVAKVGSRVTVSVIRRPR